MRSNVQQHLVGVRIFAEGFFYAESVYDCNSTAHIVFSHRKRRCATACVNSYGCGNRQISLFRALQNKTGIKLVKFFKIQKALAVDFLEQRMLYVNRVKMVKPIYCRLSFCILACDLPEIGQIFLLCKKLGIKKYDARALFYDAENILPIFIRRIFGLSNQNGLGRAVL